MVVSKRDLVSIISEQLALDPEDIHEDTALFSKMVMGCVSLISIMTLLEQKVGIGIEMPEFAVDSFGLAQ